MIEIELDRCTGCGECVEACPAGALSVEAGHARVELALCRGCEACVEACPQGAIVSVAAPVAVVEAGELQPRPAAVIDVRPPAAAPVPWSQRILALASVISYTGREVLPRVLEAIAAMPQERKPGEQAQPGPGTGQGARRRHRGRHGQG